jgi:AraC-like DNA-binding protein
MAFSGANPTFLYMAKVRDELVILDLAGLGLPEIPTLGRYCFANARPDLAPHLHRGAYEFCFLVEGRQVYRVGGQDHLLGPGDAFFTRPDERHDTHGRPQEPATLRWIQLVPPRTGRGFLGLDAAASADLAGRLAALPARRTFRSPERIHERFAAAFAAATASDRLRAACLIADLVLDACTAAQAAPATGRGSMQAAVQFIESNLHRPIRLGEVARQARLSVPWFKERFRAEVGHPPARYILRRRVDRALELLAAGRPVTRVALDLGFSSSQHLASVIRRWTGKTPRDWRTG